jgi:DNA-binding Lrp family transcriptional regulator
MKYTVLVDFKKLDHPIKVNLFLKTDMNKTKFEDCAVGDLSVNSVTKLTGDEYSYLIEGVFPNMDRLSQYLEKITENYGVIGYKVYYVTNELKTEGFLISDAAGLQKIGTAASA